MTATQVPNPAARWWFAVAAGTVAAIPLGWLLSYAAALVALLGLFFFALFGLLIGAVVYRFAAPCRPIPRKRLIFGVSFVAAFCFCLAMTVEVREFPTDKANAVLAKIHMLPEGMTAARFRDQTADFVRKTLDEQYGSHGFLGYARWILSSSVMEYRVPTRTEPFRLTAHQYRWWWVVRVVLSAVLLIFGIYSSVGSLATAADDASRRTTEPNDPRDAPAESPEHDSRHAPVEPPQDVSRASAAPASHAGS